MSQSYMLKSLKNPFKKAYRANKLAQQGCRINIQKSFAFLYTNNKQSKKEIKKILPFIIV